MEHLFNCHGEWFLALGILMDLPILRAWIRAIIIERLLKGHRHTHG